MQHRRKLIRRNVNVLIAAMRQRVEQLDDDPQWRDTGPHAKDAGDLAQLLRQFWNRWRRSLQLCYPYTFVTLVPME